MYESPIKVVEDAFNTQYENGVLRAIQNVGFHVDKLELTKALEYDRNQYIKGFEDAKAQYENPWIPCSERLPENEDYVLCWYEYKIMGGTHNGELNQTYGVGWFFKRNRSWLVDSSIGINAHVLAWMPLPEPWKGE